MNADLIGTNRSVAVLDDYLVCADLCEEHGFYDQAELLREVAKANSRCFMVMELGQGDGNRNRFVPLTVCLDQEHARRVADQATIDAFRYGDFLHRFQRLSEITNYSEVALNERIAAIIGGHYVFPGMQPHEDLDAAFPRDVSDSQMREIMNLFHVRLICVQAVELKLPRSQE